MNPDILPQITAEIVAVNQQSIIDLARSCAETGDDVAALHLRAIDIAVDLAADQLAIAQRAAKMIHPNAHLTAYHFARHQAAENLALFHVHLLDLHLDRQILQSSEPATIES